MVQTFVKKPVPVQAVRWTGYNYTELKQFAGAIISRESATTLTARISDNSYCLIKMGDWIVKEENSQYEVYPNDAFVKHYEPIEDTNTPPIDTDAIIDKLNDIQEGYKIFTEELRTLLGVTTPSEHCESTRATCRPAYEHLVDVTTPSDYERTGGVYIYRLAPGCEFKDLSSSEWTAYKDGCVFDATAERQYPAHTLKRYYINYGCGVAQLVTPYEPEERFHTLANTCFGIRKSIVTFKIIRSDSVDRADYERLRFDGDEYIWRRDGARKMISPKPDEEWKLDFCEDCVYRGDPRV